VRLVRSIMRARDRLLREEAGLTMATVAIATAFISIVVAVGAKAVQGDLNLTRNDLQHKQAYEAARAGISDYAYHLSNDINYWAKCTGVPGPHAVNQQGSTTNRRPVTDDPEATPEPTGAEYAIEMLPATTNPTPTNPPTCETADPTGSMIESSGDGLGTFRIRSTGYAGEVERAIVATLKRASFLDYIYFTQFETSDPVTFADEDWLEAANIQCGRTIRDGRYLNSIPGSGGEYCNVISFIGGEQIRGPLHTNDALVACGSPTFGRGPSDVIEVSSPPTGWYAGTNSVLGPNRPNSCPNTNPTFLGDFIRNAPVLTPPPSNQQLALIARPAFRFSGQVSITLSGANMTVRSGSPTGTVIYSGALPSNGVVWVGNGEECASGYSPYTARYDQTGCGNALVHGTYSGQLTIAAENDIVVDGNLCRSSCTSPGVGLLGLIANNFVRVYHPYEDQDSRGDCSGGDNGPGLSGSSSPNYVHAAILSIVHSFIVDHYDCGSELGTLRVNGAIAQKFRGPVGTFGSDDTGYVKDYTYDDRLRSISPPYFLDPVQAAWHVQRETLD
jgi:Flp pilus assembly pilin Flp